jgi:hypothetical protein
MAVNKKKCNHLIRLVNSMLWDFTDDEKRLVIETIADDNL